MVEKKGISYGDSYIENNVSVSDTIQNHNLEVTNILKILDFYLLKLKVNKYVDIALNSLDEKDPKQNLDFEDFEVVEGKWIIVNKGKNKGLLNINGRQLIQCAYKSIKLLDDNYAQVETDSGFGIYRFNGIDGEILKCSYKKIEYIPGIGFIITLQDGITQGVYGLNLELIIPFEYRYIYFIKGMGFNLKNIDHKWGFYNLYGKPIIIFENSWDQIRFDDI